MMPPPGAQRGAAAVLLAALLTLPVLLGVWLVDASTGPEIEQARAVLGAAAAAAADAPVLHRQIDEIQTIRESSTGLLPQANAALAASALQADIAQLVQRSGGILRSVRELPPQTEAGLERIGLMLDLSLPESALPGFLVALAGTDRFVRVVQLSVGRAGGGVLNIRCNLAGFRRAASA